MSTRSRLLAEPLHVLGIVVRNADVRRLELAWTASNLSNRASAIAVAVFAFETGGARAVGLVLFVRLAVAAAASPWLSVLADRRPRRQVLIVSDLVRFGILAAMAVLVFLDAGRLAVYVLAVLLAVAEPLFRSAHAALTPSLVASPEELTAANVVASGVESVGLFVGPALGALLLAASDVGTVFAVSAGLLLVAMALVARIGVPGEPLPAQAEAPRAHTLLAGWRTIASDPDLRVVIGLFSAQTLVAGMLNVLVVVLAIDVLDLGTAGVGWLDGTVGIGAVLGILVVTGMAGRRHLSGYFGIGLLLWGAPIALIGVWPELAPSLALLALIGIGNTLVDVAGITLMQRSAPDEVLGRVFGAFEALVLLAMGVGSLLAPALISALGARGAFIAAGLVLPLLLLPLWRPLVQVDIHAPAPTEAAALLQSVPIFAPLPPPALERLAKAVVPEHEDPGSTIFSQGDAGDRFYVISEGRAAVEIDGAPVRELAPGDFFGEIALLRDVPRTATVRALSALELVSLDRETFVATVSGHPASAEAAGSIVAARLPGPVLG
jgi:MFS family permease